MYKQKEKGMFAQNKKMQRFGHKIISFKIRKNNAIQNNTSLRLKKRLFYRYHGYYSI